MGKAVFSAETVTVSWHPSHLILVLSTGLALSFWHVLLDGQRIRKALMKSTIQNRKAVKEPILLFLYKVVLLDLKEDKVIFVCLLLHGWNCSIPLGR